MGVKLGAFVSNEFEVDHIDNDKTNDDIDNLQLLTHQQNRDKENERYRAYEQNRYILHCVNCDAPFTITEKVWNMKVAQSTINICCSRNCSNQYYSFLRIPRF